MRTLALLLLLGFAGFAPAQTGLKKTSDKPTLKSSGAIVVPGITFEKVVLTTEGKGEIAWDYEDSFSEKQSEICDGGKKLVLFPTKPGSYRIKLILWDEKKLQQILIVVSDNPNPPVPPIPPDPKPPIPPGPDPKPVDPPIPEPGFRVLVLYESDPNDKVAKLSIDQNIALSGQAVRDYLSSKCVKVNNQPEWRIFDKDSPFAKNASSIWQKAMQRKHDKLPWIIISDGKTGYEGPLPENTDKILELLKKYGGS